QSASFAVNISSISGFSQSVSLACSGAPAASSCSVSPSSVTLSANGSTSATVTITTIARTMLPSPNSRWPRTPLVPLYVLSLLVLLAFAIRSLPAPRRALVSACLILLLPLLLMSACNGGTGVNSAGGGTPAGNYQLMITGSSGATSHS